MVENYPPAALLTAPRSIKVACLRVADGFYALDIHCIKEIIRPLPIVSVPQTPAYIDGVISLRKAVIPIVDLRRRFGCSDASSDSKTRRIVICAIDGRIVGLLVDDVTEVCSCSEADIRPTPYYLSGPEAEFFPVICRNGDVLMLLLDLRKLLASDLPIKLAQAKQPATGSED
jgi:purine-binding chemotaxis protein CheW